MGLFFALAWTSFGYMVRQCAAVAPGNSPGATGGDSQRVCLQAESCQLNMQKCFAHRAHSALVLPSRASSCLALAPHACAFCFWGPPTGSPLLLARAEWQSPPFRGQNTAVIDRAPNLPRPAHASTGRSRPRHPRVDASPGRTSLKQSRVGHAAQPQCPCPRGPCQRIAPAIRPPAHSPRPTCPCRRGDPARRPRHLAPSSG